MGLKQVQRIWLISGDPGVGKTTIIRYVANRLRSEGFIVGGMITREVRRSGARIGFEIMDVASERIGVLASSEGGIGPRLGKYRVNLRDLADIGANALLSAADSSDIVVCDEIGPMELFSPDFRRAVRSVVRSGKPMLCVLHKRMKDPVLDELRGSPSSKITEVTFENRDSLSQALLEEIVSYLRDAP